MFEWGVCLRRRDNADGMRRHALRVDAEDVAVRSGAWIAPMDRNGVVVGAWCDVWGFERTDQGVYGQFQEPGEVGAQGGKEGTEQTGDQRFVVEPGDTDLVGDAYIQML